MVFLEILRRDVYKRQELAYAVEKKRDSTMPVTEEKVISPGEPGKQVDTYKVCLLYTSRCV